MELVILSGKGGTGKTSLVGSLASLAEKKVLVDCDVDAADLHLIMKTKTGPAHDFICGSKARVIQDKCMICGICSGYCRFGAIKNEPDSEARFGEKFWIDQYACEGCGVCTHFCPEDAIELIDNVSGQWYISETAYGPLVHARLGIAQGNSGRMVSLLRKEAAQIMEKNKLDLVIIDGPPGIGCPVIASVTGAGYVMIVTEPSISAFHDMERLLQLTRHFNIPTGICINKFDINTDMTARIEKFAGDTGIEILGKIAYDPGFTRAQVQGMPMIEYADTAVTGQIKQLWEKLQNNLMSAGKKAAGRKETVIKLN